MHEIYNTVTNIFSSVLLRFTQVAWGVRLHPNIWQTCPQQNGTKSLHLFRKLKLSLLPCNLKNVLGSNSLGSSPSASSHTSFSWSLLPYRLVTKKNYSKDNLVSFPCITYALWLLWKACFICWLVMWQMESVAFSFLPFWSSLILSLDRKAQGKRECKGNAYFVERSTCNNQSWPHSLIQKQQLKAAELFCLS